MEDDMLDGLYWEYLYNKGDDRNFVCPGGEEAVGPCPVAPADRNILYENRMLGLPRYAEFLEHAIIRTWFRNTCKIKILFCLRKLKNIWVNNENYLCGFIQGTQMFRTKKMQ